MTQYVNNKLVIRKVYPESHASKGKYNALLVQRTGCWLFSLLSEQQNLRLGA